jgi:chromosome segregation ATPase
MNLDTLKLQLKLSLRDLYFPLSEFLKDDLRQAQHSRDLFQAQNTLLQAALQAYAEPDGLDLRLANTKGELANAREMVERLEDDLDVERDKVGRLEKEVKDMKLELEKYRKQNGVLLSRMEGKTTSRAATPVKSSEKPPCIGIDKGCIKPFRGLLGSAIGQTEGQKSKRKTSSVDLNSSKSLVKCG